MDSDAARGETAGDAGGNAGMGKTQTASKATITSKKDTETTAGKKKGRLAGLKQGLKGCSNFLYDREKKTVMGRGGRRWGNSGTISLIYACLNCKVANHGYANCVVSFSHALHLLHSLLPEHLCALLVSHCNHHVFPGHWGTHQPLDP